MKDDPTPHDRDRADALVRAGRHAEAIPVYRRLAEARPEEESHRFALAWALHDAGQIEEAAVWFERLLDSELARRTFTGFAYDELVRLYRAGKNWEALVSVCERAVAAQPGDAALLHTLGESYLAAGKTGDAVGVFEKLTALEPDAPQNWCALGGARLAAGDPDRAEEAYGRAAQIDPGDAPVFFARLADGCIRAGYPEQARAALERSARLNPAEPLYLLGLCNILIDTGNPDAAVDTCTRAAALKPAAAGSCWHRLGNLLAKEGLHLRAAEAFTKAALAEPENPLYRLRLAAAYAAQGLDEPAAAALSQAEALAKPSDLKRR